MRNKYIVRFYVRILIEIRPHHKIDPLVNSAQWNRVPVAICCYCCCFSAWYPRFPIVLSSFCLMYFVFHLILTRKMVERWTNNGANAVGCPSFNHFSLPGTSTWECMRTYVRISYNGKFLYSLIWNVIHSNMFYIRTIE